MSSRYYLSKSSIATVIVAVFTIFVSQQKIFTEGYQYDLDNLKYNEKLLRIAQLIQSEPTLRAEWERNRARIEQREIEIRPPEFTCDTSDKSETIPTNVNELRPSDISVIAALGDSITAGNGLGANTLVEVAVANRGESFPIGGDRNLEEGVVTLPNIMKKFNPNLKGYSLCASSEELEFRSWFNVAKPGNTNDDMLSQAKFLTARMMNDTRVNYTEDWKLVTMFVGGNDLCTSCKPSSGSDSGGQHSADDYYMWFERAIQHFFDNMPRTVVNLVSMFDVTPLQNMSTGLACDLLQWGFCECGRNWTTLPALRELQFNYSQKLEELAQDPRFHTENFTVIHQPHMRDMTPPIDPNTGDYMLGFLSPDCFHPTRIAHQGFAVWLWNALLTPVGHKPTTVNSSNFEVPIGCPTKERPYIFTRENSVNVTWPPLTTPPTPSTPPPAVDGVPHFFSNTQLISMFITAIGLTISLMLQEKIQSYNL